MHVVNIFVVLTIVLITKRLDPGWWLGQDFYAMFLLLIVPCYILSL